MDKKLEILSTENCFEGFFRMQRYRLQHRLFAGGMTSDITRELFERGQAVAVLLYDPQRELVVLVEQFRIGAIHDENGAWLMEIVAGIVEENERSEDVARRESMEEAGCLVTDLIPISDYYVSPGGTSETIKIYCALIDASELGGIHGLEEEGEDIMVHVVSVDQAVDWLHEGRINSASPIIALQWLMLNKELLRAPVA